MLGHMKLISVVAAAGLASVNAQFSLSSSCTESVKGLLTSPDAACMNPAALLSFVVGTERSVPNTIDKWLTGLCAQGTCSDESLTAMATNLTTGCSEDLINAGVTQDISGSVVDIVKQVYPTARQAACLKDDTAGTLCATQTITNLESIVGQLTLDDLSFFNLLEDAQKLIASGISSFACTGCLKEAFSIARQGFPDIVSQADSAAADLCGADFIDDSLPEDVSQTAIDGVFAASAQTPDDNGSLTISSSSRAGAFLAAFGLTYLVLL